MNERTMNDMFGIRNKATGEVIRTFDNPIEAKEAVISLQPEGYADFEVVKRSSQNIYERMSDGRVYITGTEVVWIPYLI